MKVNWFLAEAARVAEGKLNVLGGGWDMIAPGAPFAVCGVIGIPWHQGTEWHRLRLELIDGDGNPFCVPVEGEEPKPLVFDPPPYRPNIPPHVKPGTTLAWPFLFNIGPGIPLAPGTIYEWRLSIDGTHEDEWTLPFTTFPALEMPEAA